VTLLVRREGEHDHERESALRGHVGEEARQGGQGAGGGRDPHDEGSSACGLRCRHRHLPPSRPRSFHGGTGHSQSDHADPRGGVGPWLQIVVSDTQPTSPGARGARRRPHFPAVLILAATRAAPGALPGLETTIPSQAWSLDVRRRRVPHARAGGPLRALWWNQQTLA
jgi:hypothetical protein